MRNTLGVLLLACAPLVAQNPYGRITGRVQDSAGAVVPSATVQARNVETGVVIETITNSEGNYEFPNLNPGDYHVAVEVTGFKRHDRGPVELRLGDALSVDITLELGSVSESVVVTADAPLLESVNAGLGQVVDHQRIQDLPMPAGNPMSLIALTPGVYSTTAPTHPWLPNAVDAASGIGAAGTRARAGEFTLDGVPNMTQGGQTSFVPPPEMIQEIRVQTAPFDASLGHFSGAHINMAVKTGANAPHGDLFFSHMSRPLMARDFFTNRAIYDTSTGPVTKEKIDSFWPYTRINHYRGSAGGPVYIPRVYDGRNRTFWMYGIDMLYRIKNEHNTFNVPSAPQRNGDFSALLALGAQYQIYDPATIAPAANGRFSRQPLAGNMIPASRIDPMAKRLMAYYPLPNLAGTADGRSNYYDPQLRTGPYSGHTARIDQVVNENNRFYFTFSRSATDVKFQQAFHNDARGQLLNRRHFGLAVDDVAMLRPNLVMDIRAGVTRYMHFQRPVSFGMDLASLGFPASLVNRLDSGVTSFPEITIDGLTALGDTSGARNPTTYYNFAVTFSHVRSAHSLRYGGEYRVLQENNYDYGNVSPAIDFSSAWTKGPLDNSGAAPSGQGLASFLFGLPAGGGIDINASYAQQSAYAATFIQDDWKIARNLTLNIGLRWEMELPITERFNRTNRGFDFTTVNPVQSAVRANYAKSPIPEIPVDQFRTVGGLMFAGVNQPRGVWDAKYRQLAPRFGLAWRARPHTVVRAGYGIFYESLGADRTNVKQQGFNQRTNLQPSLDNGQSFRATLSNPFPEGWLPASGAGAGLATYVGRSPSFFWPSRRNGYMQRWSFGIQRQIGRVLVEAAYAGNRGTHLGVPEEFNAVPRQYLSTSPVRDTAVNNFLTAQVPNPFLNIPEFAGSGMQGRNVNRQQLLKPYPQFQNVGTTLDGGSSWYHSLQLRAEKRFSQGFTLNAAYTWSKFMEAMDRLNPTDPIPEHVISDHDRPHRLVVTGIYELPFGKGKPWIAAGWPERVAGGWSVQGVYQGQSGPALAFGNVLFYGNIKDIPLPVGERTVERWFNVDAGFERDSRNALVNNIRTFPSRLNNVRGDGHNNFNLSAIKNIRLREKMRLQLRAEAVDALNHAMFEKPNMAPANTAFGRVTGVASDQQRQISVGAKLRW